MPPQSQKKRSGAPTVAAKAAKRLRLSQRSLSPREALASQATESPSEPAWETQFLESQPKAEIAAPTEGSHAGTGLIADDAGAGRSTWETDGADHFDRINWERLKQYMKPVKAPTGEAIAAVVIQTLREFGITPNQLGYFVLDNASNNDTAIAAIARDYGGFDSIHHRLRCSPHTINLIGQALLFGDDKDSYNNVAEQLRTEELYMREWRRHGQLGTLIAVINFIRTPQQHELFQACQCDANKALPADDQIPLLTPVRPVVTRWNSYHAAIKRATKLHGAFNRYMEHHIKSVAFNEKRSGSACKDVPAWMRQGGLAANDWATITEYQNCLKPLKIATKRLEGRGKVGSFGAIYEVLPVFEYILRNLEELAQPWIDVNFNAHNEAPEDHLHINLRAAWNKADAYYNKLDDSPVYYAATCLHPLYKYYCENSWSEKLEWIEAANKGFQRL
ncbi:hypothetical protein A1F99_090660 [Pyrenophora tritici-repentis]|nr:hypothetical protein A1F99_090660 [Pyrenophora tritici-repentis]KAI1684484.1 hypothetical protein KJE20_06989 [Pyrenophora tritici-repentis]